MHYARATKTCAEVKCVLVLRCFIPVFLHEEKLASLDTFLSASLPESLPTDIPVDLSRPFIAGSIHELELSSLLEFGGSAENDVNWNLRKGTCLVSDGDKASSILRVDKLSVRSCISV